MATVSIKVYDVVETAQEVHDASLEYFEKDPLFSTSKDDMNISYSRLSYRVEMILKFDASRIYDMNALPIIIGDKIDDFFGDIGDVSNIRMEDAGFDREGCQQYIVSMTLNIL